MLNSNLLKASKRVNKKQIVYAQSRGVGTVGHEAHNKPSSEIKAISNLKLKKGRRERQQKSLISCITRESEARLVELENAIKGINSAKIIPK